jgi:hypothetical protein
LFVIPEFFEKTNESFVLSLQVISYTQAFWFLLVLGIYFIFVSQYDNQIVKSTSFDQ